MAKPTEQLLAEALAHHKAGRFAEGEALYRQVLARHPENTEALHLLGLLAAQVGRKDVAIDLVGRAVALQPRNTVYCLNYAQILNVSGRIPEAIAAAQQTIAVRPDHVEAWFNLGNFLLAADRVDEAVAAYHRAIELKSDYAEAHNNLGAAYERADRLDDAAAAYHRTIELRPTHADAHNNLGVVYARKGKLDRAIPCYRRAVELDPTSPDKHSHLIYTMLHHPGFDARRIFQEHVQWAERHAAPLAGLIRPFTNDRTPGRRLRVGYVSPNFRLQAVVFFSEPIITHHDRGQFQVFCYHDWAGGDAVTERLRRRADVWRPIVGMSDEQLAEQVRQDGIDILVDLTGHLPRNRLLAFARKPAPVQVTYIGYQTTTGMLAMDYRITDAIADPPAQSDRFYTEKLVRLPLFFCYRPLDDSPDVGPLPSEASGRLTFGSMNNFVKVGPQVMDIWARILQATPGSRLLVLIAGGEKGNAHVVKAFGEHGINRDRVELVPMCPNRPYLDLYNRLDIALDSFPFSGHTTTCDALWMGVPVVSLRGKTYAGRMAASVLASAGLGHLVARTEDQYVSIALNLAADSGTLKQLRASLRQQFQASPAMDAPGFVRNLEAAYRQMWTTWCAKAKS